MKIHNYLDPMEMAQDMVTHWSDEQQYLAYEAMINSQLLYAITYTVLTLAHEATKTNTLVHSMRSYSWILWADRQPDIYEAILLLWEREDGSRYTTIGSFLQEDENTPIAWFPSPSLKDVPSNTKTPVCLRCSVPLAPGQALQNILEVGQTAVMEGSTRLIDVWKCPTCGYSRSR